MSAFNINNKNVYISGKPAAGKTTTAHKIATSHHVLVHSDDFTSNIYNLIELIKRLHINKKHYIIEGNLTDRLFLLIDKKFYPDVFIDVVASDFLIKQRFKTQRDLFKLNTALHFYAFYREKLETFFFTYKPDVLRIKMETPI